MTIPTTKSNENFESNTESTIVADSETDTLLSEGREATFFGSSQVNHPTKRKANSEEFFEAIMGNFEVIDYNRDGGFSKEELKHFIQAEGTSNQEKESAQVLLDHFGKISDFDDGLKDVVGERGEFPFVDFDNKISYTDMKVLALSLDPERFAKEHDKAEVWVIGGRFLNMLKGGVISSPFVIGSVYAGAVIGGPFVTAAFAVTGLAGAYQAKQVGAVMHYGFVEPIRMKNRIEEVASWNYFEPRQSNRQLQ